MAESQLLAEWEYEGNLPQVAEAGQLLWNGRAVRFELLEDEKHAGLYNLSISPAGDDGSWNVVLSDSKLRSHEEIQKDLTKSAKKSGWIRREFYIDSEILRLRPNGTGYWYQSHFTMSEFHLGRSAANLTSSQTYELIKGLMAKPCSDVACALRFKRMNFEEKRCRIFGFKSVEQYISAAEELRVLCHLVIYSDPLIWNERASLKNCSLVAMNKGRIAHFWSAKLNCDSPRLNFWASILEQFGPLRPQLKRLCVRDEFRFSPSLIHIGPMSPSHHEQLEARLELRSWAQAHLPPDILDEIEQFDS